MVGFTTSSLDRRGVERHQGNYEKRIKDGIALKRSRVTNSSENRGKILGFIKSKKEKLEKDPDIIKITDTDDRNREILARLHDDINLEEFTGMGLDVRKEPNNQGNLSIVSEMLSELGIEKVSKISWFKNEIATAKIGALNTQLAQTRSINSSAPENKNVIHNSYVQPIKIEKESELDEPLTKYNNLIEEYSEKKETINQALKKANNSIPEIINLYANSYNTNMEIYQKQIEPLCGYIKKNDLWLTKKINKEVDLHKLTQTEFLIVDEYNRCPANDLMNLGNVNNKYGLGGDTERTKQLSHFWFNPITHGVTEEEIKAGKFQSIEMTRLTHCYITGNGGIAKDNLPETKNLPLVRLNPAYKSEDYSEEDFINPCAIKPFADDISYDNPEEDIKNISQMIAKDTILLHEDYKGTGVVFACQQGMNRSFAYALGYEFKCELENMKTHNSNAYKELQTNEKLRKELYISFSNAKRSDMLCPHAQQNGLGGYMSPSNNKLSVAICDEIFKRMD